MPLWKWIALSVIVVLYIVLLFFTDWHSSGI